MAIIYSYPHSISILASDIVIGTTTVTVNGTQKNQTKNFSMGEISAFVMGNVPAGTLSRINDTNVSLTLTGDPVDALLKDVDIVVGWTGTLDDGRITSSAYWNLKQDPITLTTTGTSGAATLIGNILNIPNYVAGGAITLTGDVTGTGSSTIATTIAAGAVEFTMMDPVAIITSSEGIPGNNNNTTLPTTAAVKAYVDSYVVGGLVYQGGYNAATNTPNLDSPPTIPGIAVGWTFTITADGMFFTENVSVGDFIISEVNNPTTLADWTVVQSNTNLASLIQVGLGNVNAGVGIGVSYSSGTATVTNTDLGSSQNIFKNIAVAGQSTVVADTNNDTLTLVAGTGVVLTTNATTDTITITAATAATTNYATSISVTSTVTHNLNTRDVNVQLYDTVTYETIFADVARTTLNTLTITFDSAPINPIRVLVTKVG
jgi:hypothetical protein